MLSARMIGSRANHCCDLDPRFRCLSHYLVFPYRFARATRWQYGALPGRGRTLHTARSVKELGTLQRTVKRSPELLRSALQGSGHCSPRRLRTTASPRTGGFLHSPRPDNRTQCTAETRVRWQTARLRLTVPCVLRFLATGAAAICRFWQRSDRHQIGPAPHVLDSSACPPLAMVQCALSDFLVESMLPIVASLTAVCLKHDAASRDDGGPILLQIVAREASCRHRRQ